MTFLKAIICAATLVVSFAGTAPAQQGNRLIQIEEAWVRISKDNVAVASAYFTILNKSEEDDYLIGVTSSVSERALLQEMRIENFKAKYNTISKLSIGAIERQKLRPSGYQVTLEGLKRPLRIGENVQLTLTFERAGRIEIVANVSNQMLGNR